MKHILFSILLFVALATVSMQAATLVFQGTDGPGKGKHIVLLAGDHEYRSEETLPAMARLLAKHHGFKCTVLFDIDADGYISAGDPSNIPGLEALASADLAVVFLRFQHLPAEQMKHIDEYLKRGGPVVGLRTATHAFSGTKEPYAKYNYDAKEAGYELGFGHQVLGQTWVGHYGQNHRQSTRITIAPDKKDHPILRGVKDVWVQVGGYVGKPTDGEILTLAQPLNGMTPDSPVDAKKPPQPSEWTRTYKSASGKVGRVFTTLYGTSEDITNEGYRRLLMNGMFWAVGMENAIQPDLNVAFVGPFKPNTYNGGAYARGIKPEMYAGFDSPIPANNNTLRKEPKKADAKKQDGGKAEATTATGAAATLATGKPARFVRVELPGDKRILTLAEVEVFSGGKNIAREGKATQSSTHGNSGAAKAVDGNKEADWGKGGQTHTVNAGTTNPWWELDLGSAADIEKVGIWNRSGYENRLDGFTLTFLDADRKEVFRASSIAAPQGMEIDVKAGGKLAYLNYDGKPGQPMGKGVTQVAAAKQETNAREKRPAGNSEALSNAAHALTAEPAAATTQRPQAVAPPAKGERIVLLGNGLAERDVYYSRIETELALRYPEQALIVRNMGHVGDTPGFRPHPSRASQWAFPGAEKFHPDKQVHKGKGFYGTPDQWLTHLQADTIVAFFGYNESFDGSSKVANFEAELDAWVQDSLSKAYNGQAAPRIVLVSPIAFENQSAKRDLPNGEKENANLTLYANAVAKVAKKHSLTFIDLFKPTLDLYAKAPKPLTTGGFVPNDEGYQRIAELLATGLYGHQSRVSKADPALVHAAVKAKDYFWNADYNLVNGVHSYGGRYNPYGPQNYPGEVLKTREMIALRDTLIHEVATGKKTDLTVDDSRTRKLGPVPSNYAPSAKNGSEQYLYGNDALKSLTVPAGYKAELFASEKEFPNLANPMQLSFDNKGRLWVAVMPTYPHYRPGDALPNDKIIIYEDTNGDGKADKETVFADKLHLPIGFEFAPEGVYVSQEPNLVLLRDDNGDDKADRMEIILGGFDTHDTHHAISAYTADPSGAFMLCEGVFLHSNVETPYGPVRCVDGGFFRYSPQRGQLERTIQMSIPNPWGYVFDEWGQDFLLFTSGPNMNWALPVQIKPTFGSKAPPTVDLIPKGQAVRPTSGIEIVSSRHFPEEVQGDILLCNSIGYLGIKQHQIQEDGTGWKTAHRQDLLKSSDSNFRPVDLEFAPDGSLYVIDWHNVLIGHMQHNARDPLRDHVHGRIYRITYPSRPLVKPAPVAGASIAKLLENLKQPESRTRYRSRRELRGRPASQVLPAVKTWAAKQTDTHARLEALWTTWGLNATDEKLLRELLTSTDHRARAAAVRVLRYNTHRIADSAALLEKAAADSHGRVRLEATIAASWFPDKSAAKRIATVASTQSLDIWSKEVVKTTLDRLGDIAEDERPEFVAMPVPAHLKGPAVRQYTLGQEVYHRDAHCFACHLPNGKGLEGAVPPLENSPWVTGTPERLIKLSLYGLMGPIEVNGQKFDGQVPMTPFGGLLSDNELAAVLTFVRNSFGNQAKPITAAAVKKVREANPNRLMLYNTDELLKEHPLK